MEVAAEKNQLVYNVDALEFIKKRKAKRGGPVKGTKKGKGRAGQKFDVNPLEQRDWIEEEVLHYLEASQPSVKSSGSPSFNKEEALEALSAPEWSLTIAEKLQLLNHVPTEIVTLYLLVEDCTNRLDGDAQQKLLETIKKHCHCGGTDD